MIKDGMKDQWNKLNPKEKRLLVYGILLIVPVLFYFYVWVPYNKGIKDLQQQIVYQQDDLQWMQQAKLTIDTLKQGNTHQARTHKPMQGPFIDTIDQTVKRYSISHSVSRLQANGKNSLIIQFKSVTANELIKWLNYLDQLGIVVKSADINRVKSGDKANNVDARIILVLN